METQVSNLKLNVTNIKSYLINSNKELKRLKSQRKDLTIRLAKKQEVRSAEKRIETKNLGIGSGFSKIANTLTAPARSIFDKMFDFLGLVALGILVNKLPQIIKKVEEFFNSNFIKGFKAIIGALGYGFEQLENLVKIISPSVQRDVDNKLKKFGNDIDADMSSMSQAESDIAALDAELARRESEKQDKGKNQWWDFMDLFPNPKPTSTNTEPVSPAPKPKGYSRGGTVTSEGKTPGTPRASGSLKSAQVGMKSGFLDFYLAVNSIEETTALQSKSVESIKDLSKTFSTWSGVKKGDPKDSKSTNPSFIEKAKSAAKSFLGLLTTPSGPNSQYIDASGEPGADFGAGLIGPNNRAFFAGEVVEIGHQYSPNKTGGDGRMGSGYGNYVVVRSKDTNGKEYDALYAHFPDGEIKVKEGDKVTVGQNLGRMATAAEFENPQTRVRVGSGTGAHTSIDFLQPGSNRRYPGWRSLVNRIDLSFGGNKTNLSQAKVKGGGSLRGLNSYDDPQPIILIQPVETVVTVPIPIMIQAPSKPTVRRKKQSAIWRRS